MKQDYSKQVERQAQMVFDTMAPRVSAEDMERLKKAFEVARAAHSKQVRKTGEPYILHPISVAYIAAHDLMLDVNSVIAAFLHDVVEDCEEYSINDIGELFGPDVQSMVNTVTKQKDKTNSGLSKQLANYRQILNSMQYDVRPVLIKLADRLHNMRTLASMKPEKQMKIAGETDYFYAPLANRLGLYNVKTELENLSFKFRCPDVYEEIAGLIERHVEANIDNLETFRQQISDTLEKAGVKARVYVDYRRPFSLWRKMKKFGDDFNHLKYRHFVEIVFEDKQDPSLTEKGMALKIYSILTDRFTEKHGSMANYIDSPKENGYQSLHVKLLPAFGRWQEVHISSESMARQSQLGYTADANTGQVRKWLEKFRKVLSETLTNPERGAMYMEDVVSNFYNDDIQVYSPQGKLVQLPQNSTVLDFAYELHTGMGDQARYARINGRLEPVTAPLRRGDVVEVFTDPETHPEADWTQYVHTYRARKAVRRYLESLPKPAYCRCPECRPIPGEEVVGMKDPHTGMLTVHKRDCPRGIMEASSYGDDVESVDFTPDDTTYPVVLQVKAVDRHHLLIDLADCITNTLNLCMDSFNTHSERSIVVCRIHLGVHSNSELKTIMDHISAIDGVDEVKRLPDDKEKV